MRHNKHVVTAFIVAPILALISYFATDKVVSEKPSVAKEGAAYPLSVKPNCRYQSGLCTLENGDLSIHLEFSENGAGQAIIIAQSNVALEGLKVGVDGVSDELNLFDFEPQSDDRAEWVLDLVEPVSHESELKVVAKANQALFYASITGVFQAHIPLFDKQ